MGTMFGGTVHLRGLSSLLASMNADERKQSSHGQGQYSYNKKLLDNMSTLLGYIEDSRQDLISATKSVLTAYKTEFEHSKSLEDDTGKLRATIADLELARDKVEVDLLRLREAYNREVIRNEELTQTVKDLQTKLQQTVGQAASERKTSTDSASSSEAQSSSNEQSDPSAVVMHTPEQSSTNGAHSSLSRHSSSRQTPGSKRLKSSTLSYSVPNNKGPAIRSSPFRSSGAKAESTQEHCFVETSKLRFQSCGICKCSIMPTVKYFYCDKCGLKVDRACSESSNVGTCVLPKALSLEELIVADAEYAVPELVVQCCEQIEQQGLEASNLYQENEEKEAAELFAKYRASRNIAQLKLHKLDMPVLTGIVLHTLGALNSPLIGAKLWQDFARACDQKCPDQRSRLLSQLVSQLSKANRHTLAYLLLHLKHVMSKNFSNKLDKQTVAACFGPIIASDQPAKAKGSKHDQIKRAQVQRQIVLGLIELPTEFCKQVLKDQRESVAAEAKRRTTNFQVMLMNDRQRKSFYEKISSSIY